MAKKTTKTKSNLPATRKSQAPAKLSDAESAAAEYAGAGMETVGSADLLIPQLKIMQKLSPQLDKTSAMYVEGAAEGDICDTGAGRLHDEVLFVPVIYRKHWIEWAEPRGSGSIVQIYNSQSILDECTRDKDGPPRLPSGNPVIETAQFSGFLIDEKQYSKTFHRHVGCPATEIPALAQSVHFRTDTASRKGPNHGAPFLALLYLGHSARKETPRVRGPVGRFRVMSRSAKSAPNAELDFQDVMGDALLFAKAIADGHERLNMASVDNNEEAM